MSWSSSLRVLGAACLLTALLSACRGGPLRDAAVRVTLDDDQVLLGDMTVPHVSLKTGIGVLRFEASAIGELGPVEGDTMEAAENAVRVWLRDGSEFSGVWQTPEVAVQVEIGGARQVVPIPIPQLRRLQFTGDEIWPESRVVRVRTVSGDDFLVDAERSRFGLQNDLGSFHPRFDEIESLTPLDEDKKRWRVDFLNSMVLIGAVEHEVLEFPLNLGLEVVEVPVAKLVEIRQEIWGAARRLASSDSTYFENSGFLAQKAISAQTGQSLAPQNAPAPAPQTQE